MMKKIDNHGLKMVGLKNAATETKGLTGYHDAGYVQVGYNKITGEIYTNYHYSLGHNSWTEYNDSNVIHICNFCEPATMQDIADRIHDKLTEIDAFGFLTC